MTHPPPHYNPRPMFGLRVPTLSKTAAAMIVLLRAAGTRGLSIEQLHALLYMTDVIAWQYLGRPITALVWRA